MKREELLKFPYGEKVSAELIAQCAENIKMMILDDFTKLPKVYSCTAIGDLCDDIYYWQREGEDCENKCFNIVPRGADQRFKWPSYLHFLDVEDVAVMAKYHKSVEEIHPFLVKLALSILHGLSDPYEQRVAVPKNVYWEDLFDSNSLILDFLPDDVRRQLFERDDEEYDSVEGFENPHLGYLRLLHNAIAWTHLYDALDERDLLSGSDWETVTRQFRLKLRDLLCELWEPIDSLREYFQYHGPTATLAYKLSITKW